MTIETNDRTIFILQVDEQPKEVGGPVVNCLIDDDPKKVFMNMVNFFQYCIENHISQGLQLLSLFISISETVKINNPDIASSTRKTTIDAIKNKKQNDNNP
jgi:hypothetical protein